MTDSLVQKSFALTTELFSNDFKEISNAEFLSQAFNLVATDSGNNRPVTVSSAGNPSDKSFSWVAKDFDGSQAPESQDSNNFFSVATFKPDQEGRYKRQKSNFVAQWVVALDDVTGNIVEGKAKAQIPFSRIVLEPSYVLETSRGNYQVGYFLKTPIEKVSQADALSKAIISSGLSDPGASGPASRLMRLPIGCNGKYSPVFHCRLVFWKPENRYSVEELKNGLRIQMMSIVSSQQIDNSCKKASVVAGGNSVYTPAPVVNVVLERLRELGLLKREISHGKYEISCPWKNEHTECLDTGAVYWVPDENHPIGAFKCQHGHCEGRGIKQLLDHLGIEAEDAYMKARITIVPGEANRIVAAAEQELAATGRYFQKGGRIVFLQKSAVNKQLKTVEANQQSLLLDLCGCTRWQHYDARSKRYVPCDPSQKYLSAILESGIHPFLPELIGIARQPLISENGSISKEVGYNSSTGLFGDFDPSKFSINEHLTRADALSACEQLRALLKEFAFDTESDYSAALSAILTATVRAQLDFAPMFHVRAHLPGSGKSYLTTLISIFATADNVAASVFPKDDEECRKFLLAHLMQAPACIIFDNLTSDIYAFKSLCMVLTEQTLNGRILGVSRTAEVGTRTLFLSSGNNVGPVQDMSRRVLTIVLNPSEENPSTREFSNPNLLEQVRVNRELFVSCALTIVAAWLQAGSPKTPCRNIASFARWSDWCRQPLLWLGLLDPAERMFEMIENDPEKEVVGGVFTCLFSYFGKRAFSVKDVAGVVRSSSWDSELSDSFDEAGLKDGYDINRRKLGWWLRQKEGWCVNGLKLHRSCTKGKQPLFRLTNEQNQ